MSHPPLSEGAMGETKEDIGNTLMLDDVRNEPVPPDQDAMALVEAIIERAMFDPEGDRSQPKLEVDLGVIQGLAARLIALLERQAGLLPALEEATQVLENLAMVGNKAVSRDIQEALRLRVVPFRAAIDAAKGGAA